MTKILATRATVIWFVQQELAIVVLQTRHVVNIRMEYRNVVSKHKKSQ